MLLANAATVANAVFAGSCVSPSGDMTEAGLLGPRASWEERLSGPSTGKGQEEEDYDLTLQGTHATDRGRQ